MNKRFLEKLKKILHSVDSNKFCQKFLSVDFLDEKNFECCF